MIGQLGRTYIVCEDTQGLILIDQHAAHERVLYEKLKKDFDNGSLESQRLLKPHRVELNLEDIKNLNGKIELLLSIGIELSYFGGSTFLINSFPPILRNIEWDKFLNEVLRNDASKIDTIEHVLKTMACHSAIKSGDLLSLQEMEALLEELYKTDPPYCCPHGRPVLKKISYEELEKMFKRR